MVTCTACGTALRLGAGVAVRPLLAAFLVGLLMQWQVQHDRDVQ